MSIVNIIICEGNMLFELVIKSLILYIEWVLAVNPYWWDIIDVFRSIG